MHGMFEFEDMDEEDINNDKNNKYERKRYSKLLREGGFNVLSDNSYDYDYDDDY